MLERGASEVIISYDVILLHNTKLSGSGHSRKGKNISGEDSSRERTYVNRRGGACRVCPGYEKIETISIQLDDGGPKV